MEYEFSVICPSAVNSVQSATATSIIQAVVTKKSAFTSGLRPSCTMSNSVGLMLLLNVQKFQ